MSDLERGTAHLSPDRRYRYALSRTWDPELPSMLFIGLNPSTADENTLDPTLRRCIGFAKREGCGALWVGNLFALRSTDPRLLRTSKSPVGPDNDAWLSAMAGWSDRIVCCWGTRGDWQGRARQVLNLLSAHPLACLGRTHSGYPRHPLYLKTDTPLEAL